MPGFRTSVAILLLSTLFLPRGAAPLERTLTRTSDDSAWGSVGTGSISLQYWNSCNGWVWTWSDWPPYERIGVVWDAGESAYLESVEMNVGQGSPPGYGFTGFLQVYLANANDCLFGGALLTIPTLLQEGVRIYPLGVMVPAKFAVTYTPVGPFSSPYRLRSDFSAAGPTGPAGCGTCFPTTRMTHSYVFGPPSDPECPGIRINDNVCDCEWLWTAHLSLPVEVEEGSWGAVKSLYR